MKVGTDAMLLGAWVLPGHDEARILDVGCGTGTGRQGRSTVGSSLGVYPRARVCACAWMRVSVPQKHVRVCMPQRHGTTLKIIIELAQHSFEERVSRRCYVAALQAF